MTKLQTIRQVLEQRADLREWYETEHGLRADAMTEQSVRTYGTGGHGDLADQILSDAGINE